MKSIEIPDSLYEAIVEIGKLRKTQNNRATGDPLYFSSMLDDIDSWALFNGYES